MANNAPTDISLTKFEWIGLLDGNDTVDEYALTTDPDGGHTSFVLDLNDPNPSANWNVFPNWQGEGVRLVEIPICNN
tara:strand:- start:702 stop:932 length:231 start_codon:yes stop_codon:yes gene_type:complete